MSDGTNHGDPTLEQWSAFQKIWGETFSRMMQLGFTASPDAVPPEILRQIRSGILQAMAQSWDQFLRSPQFLESTKQWMDGALAFRKLSTDFLTKVRHGGEGAAREDVDAVMQGLRHLEGRILARLDEIVARLEAVETKAPRAGGRGRAAKSAAPSTRGRARSAGRGGVRGRRRNP